MQSADINRIRDHFDALAKSPDLTPVQIAFVITYVDEICKVMLVDELYPNITSMAIGHFRTVGQYVGQIRNLILGALSNAPARQPRVPGTGFSYSWPDAAKFSSTDYRTIFNQYAEKCRAAADTASWLASYSPGDHGADSASRSTVGAANTSNDAVTGKSC